MNLYTRNDLVAKTMFSMSQIRSLSKKGFFKEMQLIEGKYMFTQNDLDSLFTMEENINQSFSTQDVQELLVGVKGKAPKEIIRKHNLKENIDFFRFCGAYYFYKDSILNISQSQSIDSNKYITVTEANKILGKKTYVHERIRKGDIESYNFVGVQDSYITRTDLDLLKTEIEILNTHYTTTDIAKLFNTPFNDLSPDRLSALNPKRLHNKLYFAKDTIDSIVRKLTIKEIHNLYCLKRIEPVHSTIPIVSTIPKGYLTISQMIEKFGYSIDIYKNCIKRNICTQVVMIGKTYYMNPDEFAKILARMEQSISAKDLYDKVLLETGVKLPIANAEPLKKLFPTAFLWDELGQKHYRVPLKDFKYFMNNNFQKVKIEFLTKNEKNAHILLDLLFSTLDNNKYPITTKEFKIYATGVLNKSNAKSKRLLAYNLFATLEEFFKVNTKEFFQLTDKECSAIIVNLPIRCKVHFTQFLNDYRSKYPDNCIYKNAYNNYVSVERKESKDECYTKEEWFGYLNYLCDIDTHIVNALERQSYARRWLYLILHFCTAFRRSTYFDLPNTNIDCKKYDLNWFKSNTFTMTDAQEVINTVKLVYDNTYSNKNGAKNHFIVYPCMVIPVAIAFICAEKHSQLTNTKLIGRLSSSKSDFEKYFGTHMNGFTSIKANRTLLTYCYNASSNKEGYVDISYSLASTLRSHRMNNMGVAPTTQMYITTTNTDGDSSNVVGQLYQRGVFGWLYKAILDIAFGTENNTILDTTQQIQELQNYIEAKNIENLSKILQHEALTKQNVIKELLSMDSYELKTLLNKLLNFELPSKINYTQCIKSDACPYPLNTQCYSCKYSIPTNYTLLIINNKLIEFLDKLNECDMDSIGERIYYSNIILKLLRVIQQAKKDFVNFDSENKTYIDSFLNIKIIQEKFNLISETKLLIK